MIRNLPNRYSQDELIDELEGLGFADTFDFFYAPIDVGTMGNVGYAFVNFLSASDAARCWQNFEGFTEWGVPSDKVCEMTWGHPHQGFQRTLARQGGLP